GGAQQGAEERGDGALAVGPGDEAQPRWRGGEQLERQAELAVNRGRGRALAAALHDRLRRHAGAEDQRIDAGERLRWRLRGAEERLRPLGQALDARVAVVDPHRGAEITEQARRRDPALAHPDDERVAWKRERHRSFSVARATRASMMLMIQ